jgi:hypothetical protein
MFYFLFSSRSEAADNSDPGKVMHACMSRGSYGAGIQIAQCESFLRRTVQLVIFFPSPCMKCSSPLDDGWARLLERTRSFF